MGKKQHQKDKLYLTCSEWSNLYGGKKRTAEVGDKAEFRRLPFDHCALTLQPFEHPVCTPKGVIYELMSILPFLKKYGIDPATGEKLERGSLVKLNFTKNSDGKYHCPVLYKIFNENSHIVAIKTTGNVFSYEAVEELNIKAKNFVDLLSSEPFARKDIITLQDPTNLDKFNFSSFHHIQKGLKVPDEDDDGDGPSTSGTSQLRTVDSVTRETLDELKREGNKWTLEPDKPSKEQRSVDRFNAAHYSTGAVAASSTSTAVEVSTIQQACALEDDVVRYSRVKKKGYVQIETSFGPLNLELHCDITPRACENFTKLAQKEYYDGTVFHRSIRNFMIQGGDPTATGKGGESFWGEPFKDEFRPNLSHKGRGILSMANSGPNTNKSQFFITYRSCQHLDKKHTVFGRVVGGLDTLSAMEKVEVDEEDRPKKEIKIIKARVFVDPFQEADECLAKERAEDEAKKKKQREEFNRPASEQGQLKKKMKTFREGVGKYIGGQSSDVGSVDSVPTKKKKAVSGGFGDFSSW